MAADKYAVFSSENKQPTLFSFPNTTLEHETKLNKVRTTHGRESSPRSPFRESSCLDAEGKRENRQVGIIPTRSPTRAPANPLSSRFDPNSSFSDWAIEVIAVKDNGKIYILDKYHCHSNVLAGGPRRGNFFVKLFQRQMSKPTSSTRISKIKMYEAEAKSFPLVLDFMYCESTLSLSTDQAHILYSMADTFDIPQLKEAIKGFVQNAMGPQQLVEFLQCALGYERKERIQKLILLAESKLCGYLVKNTLKVAKVPPSLLYRILHKRAQCINVLKKKNPEKYTKQWEIERSIMIGRVVGESCFEAACSQNASKVLTTQLLKRITNPKILPVIDSDAALKLLQVQALLVQLESSQRDSADTNPFPADSTYGNVRIRKLSSLQQRCVQALTREWRSKYAEERSFLLASLRNIAPNVLTELLFAVSQMYEESKPFQEPPSSRILDATIKQREYSEADVQEIMAQPYENW
jgi:hypothetical protein